MNKSRVVLGFVFCFLSLSVFAGWFGGNDVTHYDYHPSLSLMLGGGFDPAHITQSFRDCLEFDKQVVDGVGSDKAEMTLSLVSSKQQFLSQLGISSRVTAQAYFAGGEAGVGYLDQVSFARDSLTLVIVGKTQYGRTAIKNPKLKPEFQALIDAGQHEKFAKFCGTHFVRDVRTGASVFAIVEMKQLTEEKKKEIEAHAKASASFMGASVGAETNFKNSMSEIMQSSQTTVRIYSTGGKGIVELNKVPGASNDIMKLKEVLGDYLSSMTLENAAPVRYQTASMEQFGWKNIQDFDINERDDVLSQYYFLIGEAKNTHRQLFDIVDGRDDRYAYLRNEEIAYFERLNEQYLAQISQIKQDAKACLQESDNYHAPKHIKLEKVIWPRAVVKQDPESRILKSAGNRETIAEKTSKKECHRKRQAAYQNGCITDKQLEELEIVNGKPICDGTELEAWVPCASE